MRTNVYPLPVKPAGLLGDILRFKPVKPGDLLGDILRFFEWQRGGGRKQPYFIQFADSSPTEEMMEISAEKEEDEGSQDIPGGEWSRGR